MCAYVRNVCTYMYMCTENMCRICVDICVDMYANVHLSTCLLNMCTCVRNMCTYVCIFAWRQMREIV